MILHVVRSYPPTLGGLETATAGLARWQSTQTDVSVLRIRPGHSVLDPATGAVLLDERPDHLIRKATVIHLHGADSSVFRFLWSLRPRSAVVVWSTHGGIFHNGEPISKRLFWRYVLPQFLSKVSGIAASSASDMRMLPPSLQRRATVLPNGLSVPSEASTGHRRHDRRLVFVGRDVPHKRVDLLEDVAGLLQPHGYELLLAGPSSALRAPPNGNVTRLGPLNEGEKWTLLRSAAWFLTASQFEGFGVAVLEAMAAGAAVIANDIPAHRELIRSGVNGWLTDFRSPGTVAGLILRTAQHQRQRLADHGHLAASGYLWDVIGPRFLAFYEAVRS